MNPQLLIAAAIAAAGFSGGWHLQTLRYTAQEHERDQQKLAQVQQSAAASIRRADNVISAQVDATARDVGLRRDLNNARTESYKLRIALRAMPAADPTTGTCPNRADPARELLAACAAELVEMGGIADRHASDALMLQQAWPK